MVKSERELILVNVVSWEEGNDVSVGIGFVCICIVGENENVRGRSNLSILFGMCVEQYFVFWNANASCVDADGDNRITNVAVR